MKPTYSIAFLSLVLGYTSAACAATFTGLGELSGGFSSSNAAGVSADGSVVVGTAGSAAGWEAYRWTIGGGMVAWAT